jgi:uncharacterized protein (DUF1778 family)
MAHKKRTIFVNFRVSQDEQKLINELAVSEGLGVSETLRLIIRETAKQRDLFEQEKNNIHNPR